jgi:soluble lytic murein transglycosylase-like protein
MRKLILLAGAVVVLSGCTPEQITFWYNQDPTTRQALIDHVVHEAADEYGVDESLMDKIIDCESGGDPLAYNRSSGAAGLGQHLRRYWPGRAAAVGSPDAPWFDPVTNARVTAWMLSTQGTAPWKASKACWR